MSDQVTQSPIRSHQQVIGVSTLTWFSFFYNLWSQYQVISISTLTWFIFFHNLSGHITKSSAVQHSPGYQPFNTYLDISLSTLTYISAFQHSPGYQPFNNHLYISLSTLTYISAFQHSPGYQPFNTHLYISLSTLTYIPTYISAFQHSPIYQHFNTNLVQLLPQVEDRTQLSGPHLLVEATGLHVCTLQDAQLGDHLHTDDALG